MIDIYNKLLELDSDRNYHVVFTNDNDSFYFGKDPDDNVIFLIKSSNIESNIVANSSRGNLLNISFNIICEFILNGEQSNGNFTMLSLKTDNKLITQLFISLCLDIINLIGDKVEFPRVVEVVNGVRELFMNFLRPSIKDEIGIWGELFIISQAKDTKNAIDSWHLDAYDTFDFNDGDNKMEVNELAKLIKERKSE